MIFVIKDKSDIPTLRAYDYQALAKDVLNKIDPAGADTTAISRGTREPGDTTEQLEEWSSYRRSGNENSDYTERSGYSKGTRYRGRRSYQLLNFDIGMNNILSNGKFPDDSNEPYAVRPWGSWYVGINSIEKIRIARNFFVELGLGISWYNFKFQSDTLVLIKGPAQLEYAGIPDGVDPIKSKLTATYIHASFVPVLDFGKHPHRSRYWGSRDGFRIGAGPYVGYRIDSYTKQVYEENGNRERDRERSNYYLNNLRYGARLQVGYRGTDLFVNYDLNELFATNRGPNVNAFSFGLIF